MRSFSRSEAKELSYFFVLGQPQWGRLIFGTEMPNVQQK